MGAELAGRAHGRTQPASPQADELEVIAEILARMCAGWPSADLAQLIVGLKKILDARAAHHAEGGGILDALDSHHDGQR